MQWGRGAWFRSLVPGGDADYSRGKNTLRLSRANLADLEINPQAAARSRSRHARQRNKKRSDARRSCVRLRRLSSYLRRARPPRVVPAQHRPRQPRGGGEVRGRRGGGGRRRHQPHHSFCALHRGCELAEDLRHHHAEREDVAARVRRPGVAAEALGRRVGGRACNEGQSEQSGAREPQGGGLGRAWPRLPQPPATPCARSSQSRPA